MTQCWVYSIYEYNKHKGREDKKYRDDDKILHEHIRIVNTFVRETNPDILTYLWILIQSIHHVA
jgi:hypothetical protein